VWADDAYTQVTGGGGSAWHYLAGSGIHRCVPLIAHHSNIAVGAIRFAQAAADAVAFDFDFRAFAAMDGIHWAAYQAVGVFTASASASHEEMAETEAIALQPRHAAVRVGARLSAFVAARAALQIQHEQLLRIEQTLIEELA